MNAGKPVRASRGVKPYLLHLRPAEWPVMAAHTTVGLLLASGLRAPAPVAWLGVAAWVVLLNGGTLALNSAFDRDEGDIAFLRNPPAPPKALALFAAVLMIGGLALTWRFGPTYRVLYLVCMAMSAAYSVPPLRLKAVAGVDWAINMLGFGVLTPWAGWAASGRPLAGPLVPVLWSFLPLFAALYPLTQLYQIDEDRARGDRTLAVRLGVRTSVTVAISCAALA
ncbi:MAG: UbiA family prenyltransferase, partial [Gemmatimonadota bacterium]